VSTLRIVADENIPFAQEAFSTLGQVTLVPGREMTAETVRDCDILCCRSVTRVGPDLLEGSRVRFVGTATIGIDHVDVAYLRRRGIAFASAPGSNANSVAEYVVAALLVLARRYAFRLEGKTIGVVGVGNVGSRVARKARALGMRVLLNDPPLARQTGDPRFLPLDALFGADFITLHVPLTRSGPDPTWHMADARFLERMRPDAFFINTSRGAVADTEALKGALRGERLAGAVLDVWEDEPAIDLELLRLVEIGTPHIAGYSFDGKVCATEMIYRAACEALGVEPTWDPSPFMPPPAHPRLVLDRSSRHDEDVVREAVLTIYDIEADDRALRQCPADPQARGAHFDHLRKTYPERREFHNTTVVVHDHSPALARKLEGLGFKVAV